MPPKQRIRGTAWALSSLSTQQPPPVYPFLALAADIRLRSAVSHLWMAGQIVDFCSAVTAHGTLLLRNGYIADGTCGPSRRPRCCATTRAPGGCNIQQGRDRHGRAGHGGIGSARACHRRTNCSQELGSLPPSPRERAPGKKVGEGGSCHGGGKRETGKKRRGRGEGEDGKEGGWRRRRTPRRGPTSGNIGEAGGWDSGEQRRGQTEGRQEAHAKQGTHEAVRSDLLQRCTRPDAAMARGRTVCDSLLCSRLCRLDGLGVPPSGLRLWCRRDYFVPQLEMFSRDGVGDSSLGAGDLPPFLGHNNALLSPNDNGPVV